MPIENKDSLVPITRLTALWALSESMLGGLLHAAHIPFRGMIISSAAVIVICLIAHFSAKRGEILKATIVVLIIKATISPHTPAVAYLAVFMQGFFGEIIFFNKRFFTASSILLGFMIGILTGSHRIITYTLILGTTFWESINEFMRYVVKEFLITSKNEISFNFSLFLISVYVFIHAVFGFASGLLASKLPQKLNSEKAKKMILTEAELSANKIDMLNRIKIRKPFWKKFTYNLILTIIGFLLILTYITPQAINISQKSILIMIFRAIFITVIWFFLLSPFILRIIKKLLHKRQNSYSNYVNDIIDHFPFYKLTAVTIWQASSKQKGIRRIHYFITAIIANVLTLKFRD